MAVDASSSNTVAGQAATGSGLGRGRLVYGNRQPEGPNGDINSEQGNDGGQYSVFSLLIHPAKIVLNRIDCCDFSIAEDQ